jgi:hypothetical protein
VIALATLAALGEAIHEAQAEAAIAAVCIAIILAAAVAALVIPRGWLGERLRETLHGPGPRCDLCGHEGPVGRFGALVACIDDKACDRRRRERSGAEGAGE